MSPQPNTQSEHAAGSPAWLIQQAVRLERDRGEIMGKVAANRDLLRSLDKVGALSEQEQEFVRTFYPLKTRGTHVNPELVERTRELRQRARESA